MRKQKVLISGGGVPGLSLAVSLASADVDITLAEPRPPVDASPTPGKPDGRTAAIMVDHIDWLHELGVWEKVKAWAAPLKTMRVIDASVPHSKATAPHDFNAADIGLDAFAWNTPIAGLRYALWQALPSNVTIVERADHTDDYDLVIAADGRHSSLRDMAGIKASLHDTGQAALTFVVSHTHDHQNISTEIQRVDGPLTFVPLPGGHHASVVFVGKIENQQALLARGNDAIQNAINQFADGYVIQGDAGLHPLPFMTVDRLWSGKTIAMAEAAHVLHPLGAQGLNLSLRDARVLSDLIAKALETGTPINHQLHVMDAYTKARRADHLLRTGGIMASLDMLKQGAWTGRPRRLILDALDAMPALRRLAMKTGFGGR